MPEELCFFSPEGLELRITKHRDSNLFLSFSKNGEEIVGTGMPIRYLYGVLGHHFDTTDDPGFFDENGEKRPNPYPAI